MRTPWIRSFVLALLLVFAGTGLAWAQVDAHKLFLDGFRLLEAGKAKAAAARFEWGLDVEPDNAQARFYLGEAYLATGRKNHAIEQWRRSLAIDADSLVAADARKRLSEWSGEPVAGGGDAGNVRTARTFIQECPLCPELVVVPAGQFMMGSLPGEPGRHGDEGPTHLVVIARPFAVGRYEVTFDEWEACVAGGACARADDQGYGRRRRPVINVSFEQVIGYTEWLAAKTGRKYRLLSEAEWEYVARAGSGESRFWGESADSACGFANVNDLTSVRVNRFDWESFTCDDGFAQTAPVGTFEPNAFGLHDLMGNVWEWVDDCYHETYEGAPAAGTVWDTGDCSQRVTRGGGWFNGPSYVRSAARFKTKATFRGGYLGFRVARTLP